MGERSVRACERSRRIGIASIIALLAYLALEAGVRERPIEAPTEITRAHDWFVVALLRDNAPIADQWVRAVLQVASEMRAAGSRVHVSVLENGDSADRTARVLDTVLAPGLDRLGVPHTIVTRPVVKRAPDMGRIAWLSLLRNTALEPLTGGKTDLRIERTRVLYLNDVWLHASDVRALIDTNGGEYTMACAVDYYFTFYDTWVSRDSNGRALAGLYPHFAGKGDAAAFAAHAPVPVRSCWNGAVVVGAAPFVHGGVRFRDVPGESECTVVCWDVAAHARASGTEPRILVNPRVVLAYNRWLYGLQRYVAPLFHRVLYVLHQLLY